MGGRKSCHSMPPLLQTAMSYAASLIVVSRFARPPFHWQLLDAAVPSSRCFSPPSSIMRPLYLPSKFLISIMHGALCGRPLAASHFSSSSRRDASPFLPAVLPLVAKRSSLPFCLYLYQYRFHLSSSHHRPAIGTEGEKHKVLGELSEKSSITTSQGSMLPPPRQGGEEGGSSGWRR